MANQLPEEISLQWKSVFYNSKDVEENGYLADQKESTWYEKPLTDEIIQMVGQKAKELGFDAFEIIEKQEKIKRYQVKKLE